MTEDPSISSERNQMDINRANWDERVPIHVEDQTGYYDVEAFLDGTDTLMPIEAAEIGDVENLNTIHLQCHFGLDTLSLTRRGAHVTGVDFSQTAITAAQELASRANLEADFICANVYDAATHLGNNRFDLAYITWGALGWLPDIHRWGKIISLLLRSGGRVYLADKHPTLEQLTSNADDLSFVRPWRSSRAAGAIACEPIQTYAGDARELSNKTTYEWVHPMSDIITSLIQAGLQINFLHEHDTLPWRSLRCMVEAGDNMYKLPDHMYGPPVSFSLMATKA